MQSGFVIVDIYMPVLTTKFLRRYVTMANISPTDAPDEVSEELLENTLDLPSNQHE